MQTKKVIVARATGTLGSQIVKALLAHGAEVTAMVRASGNRGSLAAMGVRNFVVGDMMDAASLKDALSPEHGFDVIALPLTSAGTSR
jgi:uncharacterized protein YbjT (DUF2867 family)